MSGAGDNISSMRLTPKVAALIARASVAVIGLGSWRERRRGNPS